MPSLKNMLSVVLVIGAGAAGPLAAQSASTLQALPVSASADSSRADTAGVAGPRIGSTATGIRHQSQAAVTPIRTQPVSMGKPMALMIVGGAAFVLGAVIGQEAGTLFMIGGAAAFLIGLYQYVK